MTLILGMSIAGETNQPHANALLALEKGPGAWRRG